MKKETLKMKKVTVTGFLVLSSLAFASGSTDKPIAVGSFDDSPGYMTPGQGISIDGSTFETTNWCLNGTQSDRTVTPEVRYKIQKEFPDNGLDEMKITIMAIVVNKVTDFKPTEFKKDGEGSYLALKNEPVSKGVTRFDQVCGNKYIAAMELGGRIELQTTVKIEANNPKAADIPETDVGNSNEDRALFARLYDQVATNVKSSYKIVGFAGGVDPGVSTDPNSPGSSFAINGESGEKFLESFDKYEALFLSSKYENLQYVVPSDYPKK